MSTLRLLCVFSKSALANSGQTPSSRRKKNSGFSLGLLSVGLGLIGTVSKRLILAGITLMKNPTYNIIYTYHVQNNQYPFAEADSYSDSRDLFSIRVYFM